MITALDHIAIAVPDLDKAIKRFMEDFGLPFEGTEDVEAARVEVLRRLATHPDIAPAAARKWRRLWRDADPAGADAHESAASAEADAGANEAPEPPVARSSKNSGRSPPSPRFGCASSGPKSRPNAMCSSGPRC